jgi:hypothetical protein
MIGVTLFGIFLTPVFYSVVRRLSGPPAVEQALALDAGAAAAETISQSFKGSQT